MKIINYSPSFSKYESSGVAHGLHKVSNKQGTSAQSHFAQWNEDWTLIADMSE